MALIALATVAVAQVLTPPTAAQVSPPPVAPPECATANADGTYTVPIDWGLIPSAGVGYSSTFRLLFVSSTLRFADSSDIADYNTFVQERAKAGHRAISDSCADLFKVVGSTSTVDARDNTATTGTGERIFWLNGQKLADDYPDFYDGSWDSIQGRDESGTSGAGGAVFTGSNQDGTKHATEVLGSGGDVRYGHLQGTDNPISDATEDGASNRNRFYGLSPVFRVDSPPANADGSYTVHVDWPLVPSGIADGNKFRLLFKTSQKRDAMSSDITDYNHFVQNSARGGHTDIRDYASTFNVVGCTSAVNARTNTGTTPTGGENIYWLGGNKIADDYADFYDGSWDTGGTLAEVRNEDGTVGNDDWPATGCNNDGSAHASERLGDTRVRMGASHAGGNDGVINEAGGASSTERPLYALSPVFLVSADPVVSVGLPSLEGVTKRDGALVLEEGTGTGTLNLTSTPATTSGLTVCLSVTETGGNRLADSAKGSLTATIPANSLSVDYFVNWSDNANDDSDSVVTVTVVDPSDSSCSQTGYRASLIEPSGSLIVTDDEATTVTLTGTDLTMTESTASDTAQATVTLSRQLVAGEKIVVGLVVRTTTGARLPGHATADFMTSVAGEGVTGDLLNSIRPRVIFTGHDTDSVHEATVTFTPVSGRTDGDTADETITVELDNDTVLGTDSLGTNVGGRASRGTPFSQTLTLTDLGASALVFDPTSLTMTEGATANYTVKLSTVPTGNVTVTPLSDNSDVTFSPTSLTFTTGNFSIARTVTVSADSDTDIADDTATISHSASGGGYGSATGNVQVTVTDTTKTLVFAPTSVTVTEEGTSTYTVALGTPPTADVTVTPSSNNSDVTFSPATLTFTTLTWNTAQTVTVSAASDTDTANDTATISHSASGGGYGSATGNVQVTVTDTTVVTSNTPVTVPADWPLKPSGVPDGGRFRLLFKTSQTGDAASTDIATYNTRVENSANSANAHDSIKPYASQFKALGCTATVDAHTNTGTAKTGGVPIYWLNGPKLADDYADFYDGSWDDDAIGNTRDERGQQPAAANWPWTGCEGDGDSHTNSLGTSNVRRGRSHDHSAHNPIDHVDNGQANLHTLYAMSPVFVVATSTRYEEAYIALVALDSSGNRAVGNSHYQDEFPWPEATSPLKFRITHVREEEVATGFHRDITVNYYVTDNRSGLPQCRHAEGGYKQVTLPAGTGNLDVEIPISANTGCGDGNNKVNIRLLGSGNGDYIGGLGYLKYWIQDGSDGTRSSDAGVRASIVVDNPLDETYATSKSEGRTAFFKVKLASGAPANNFTVHLKVNGADGFLPDGYDRRRTVRFQQGETEKTFMVPTVNDENAEPSNNMTVVLTDHLGRTVSEGGNAFVEGVVHNNLRRHYQVSYVRNPDGYGGKLDNIYLAPPFAQVRIIDDDGGPRAEVPPAEISILAAFAGNEGDQAGFTLQANPAPPPGGTIAVSVTVTATGDFGVQTGERTVTIDSSGYGDLVIETTNDGNDEPDGTVTLTINEGDGYTRAPLFWFWTITILDDDVGGFVELPLTQAEPEVKAMPLPAHHPTLKYADLVATLEGRIAEQTDDGLKNFYKDWWKRILKTLDHPQYKSIGQPPFSVAQAQSNVDWGFGDIWPQILAALTYAKTYDPDATPTPTPTTQDATPEITISGGSRITEGGTASFTISASPAPTSPITVNVGVSQSGDFGATGAATVSVSSATTTYTVTTSGDDVDEPNGDVTVTVQSGSGYTVGSTPMARVSVADDDATPIVPQPVVLTISGGGPIAEGGSTSFTINADSAPSSPITVNMGLTQTGGYEATGPSTTVTLSGTSATYTVSVPNNNIDQADGSVTVTVNSGTGYRVGANSTRTVVIADNDVPQITISAGSAITEGGTASFTISASPAPHSPITVNIGVAQSGDFGATGAATVSVSSATTTYTVTTSDDNADEPNGSVTATVQSGNGYTVGSIPSATVAVSDDDEPSPVVEEPQAPLVKYASVVKRFYDKLTSRNQHGIGPEGGWNKRFLKAMGHPEYVNYPQDAVSVARATEIYNHGGPGANTAWAGTADAIAYAQSYTP